MKGYYKNRQWNFLLSMEEYSKNIGTFEPSMASKKLGLKVKNISIDDKAVINITAKKA